MKNKICFVVSSPFTARAFLSDHIKTLAQDYDIYLVANFNEDLINDFNDLPLTEIIHIPISRKIHIWKDVKAVFKLKRYFKKNQFSLVHSITPKAGLLSMIGGRMAGVRNRIHIYTGQVWYTKRGFFKWLLKNFDRLIASNATHILVDGMSQREFLIANKILTSENSRVLGQGSISGVDLKRFSFNEVKRHQMRHLLGYKDKDVVYFFLGRFKTDKGLLDLAHAFKKLSLNLHSAKLLLVGFDEENLEVQLKNIVSDDSLIQIEGPTSKPEDYLQAADVFCLPSYREGFGTSVIEASSVRLPVICSNTYGLRGTIVDNETGLYHNLGDRDDLFEKMQRLYDDEELRYKLGKQGVEFVKKNFSKAAITNEWVAFYKSILF